RDLGANELQVLNKVLLPHLFLAILGGFFMTLTYSLDDFTVSLFVKGMGFSVLSEEVYSMARMGISMEINARSTVLLITKSIGILGYYLIQKIIKRNKALKQVTQQ